MTATPVAVITGTTHGIGTVTSLGWRAPATRSSCCVAMCRPPPRWRSDISGSSARAAEVEVVHCDLASLASVRAAAASRCASGYPRIDRLINNAGIVSTRQRFSVDGHELTFATNHLGPFLLTRLLLAALAPAPASSTSPRRCTTGAAWTWTASTTDAPATAASPPIPARSLRTCWIPWSWRGGWPARGITVNCLHPGVVATHLLPGWLNLIRPLFKRSILTRRTGCADQRCTWPWIRARRRAAGRVPGRAPAGAAARPPRRCDRRCRSSYWPAAPAGRVSIRPAPERKRICTS